MPPGERAVDAVEHLDSDACLDLLSASSLGRLGFSASALPLVLPIQFALHGPSIVFKAEDGPKVAAARTSAVACLEVDDFDAEGNGDWSVVATGRLREITHPEHLAIAERLPLASWPHEDATAFVELSIELLTGHRLRR